MDVSVELPYLINDADNHFVEPLDMYERYIDPKWRDKAVRLSSGRPKPDQGTVLSQTSASACNRAAAGDTFHVAVSI